MGENSTGEPEVDSRINRQFQSLKEKQVKGGRNKLGRGKGYYFHKERKKWYASICVLGKRKSLGYHETEDQAAIAYNTEYAKVKSRNESVETEKNLCSI